MKSHSVNNARQRSAPTLAKPLAPEDVAVGDYVAVLDEQFESPAFVWICESTYHCDDILRFRLRPQQPVGPLRIVDICLPFVCVRTPMGQHQTLDLRAVWLARLDPQFGKRVSEKLSGKRKRRSKKKKKKPSRKR